MSTLSPEDINAIADEVVERIAKMLAPQRQAVEISGAPVVCSVDMEIAMVKAAGMDLGDYLRTRHKRLGKAGRSTKGGAYAKQRAQKGDQRSQP